MSRPLVPALGAHLHKGQAGRVAVVGGSLEYTGAPYLAAMTALRVGADISHVFCTREAGPPIKSYSPDLIVHPVLRHDGTDAEVERAAADVAAWLPTLHALVVGPGLGRNEAVLNTARAVLTRAAAAGLRVVLDGDGLWAVREHWHLVRAFGARAVITPNAAEWTRLQTQLSLAPDCDARAVSAALGGVIVVRKGAADEISNATHTVRVADAGALKRCGGQGDVLAGCMAVFCAWSGDAGPTLDACAAACRVVRHASARAYAARLRSMVASDVLAEVGAAMQSLHPVDAKY